MLIIIVKIEIYKIYEIIKNILNPEKVQLEIVDSNI